MSKKKNYINGEWVSGSSSRLSLNPSDVSDVIGQYEDAGIPDVDVAVESARAAFRAWSRTSIQKRHDVLRFISDEIMNRREEFGYLLTREEGKTLFKGVYEATRAARSFDYYAGEVLRLGGEKFQSVKPESDPEIEADITREPIGVIGIITPWNLPVAIPAWKIAPALAYGNTVVFKPAELTPGCAWFLADIISRSGLPDGAFNLVMGSGAEVGQAIVEHPHVSAVSFTGKQETGALIAQACSARFADFQLAMGGKNPLVVLDDADLERAVECAISGSFHSTGQRCTSSSRLVVCEGIHDRFIDAMIGRMSKLAVNDARRSNTDIGPVVDELKLKQDMDYIEIGKTEGAVLAYGGEHLALETEGHFLSPALFVETSNDMRINREEILGPVASVIRVKDYEEALDIANDTEFGLSAGICTTSLKHASHFKRNAQAGLVMVNLPTAGVDYHLPFGGRKKSSFGSREQGRHAAEFFTTVKTTYLRP